jgi:pimeloyl-ACP methyl ester carboxylesterase
MRVAANGLEFEVEIDGVDDALPVLLIMGLGMQLVAWPPAFVRTLTSAGFRVIRFDNRDIGLSSKTSAQVGNLAWQAIRHRLGMGAKAPYLLRDMVADTRGILDALSIDRCHVIGASMGGMIAQGLAASAPERVLSLTSIMSTTGARNLPQANLKTSLALISRPKSRDREALLDHFVKVFRIIGSPGFPISEKDLRVRIAFGLDRSYYPAGSIKQLAAIMASGDRSDEVRKIVAPTLVLHGREDPLVPVAHGRDTAAKIRGAQLQVIDGMGHDFAPGVVEELGKRIVPFLLENGKELFR